ncbi:MAG: hypothetical protein RLZZ26_505 [Candidatus Parcubacteria bacterium]|jgi:hypothetical protein
MNNRLIGSIVIALVVGFGAGYYLHPSNAPQTAANTPTRGSGAYGGGRGAGGANGGGFLSGTVAAEDATSITLNTRDGSSHVVLVTPSTSVSKSVAGALTDVSIGSNIMVSGTSNSDGSVSAANIQLRPAMPPAPTPQ